MKNAMILGLAIFLAACGAAPEGEQVEAQEAVETTTPAAVEATMVAVDTEASVINWIGAKFTGDQHTGTINIADGNLLVEGDQLVGGKFAIDMSTIAVTDETPDGGKAKLVGHLSTGDFFEVEKFPTATFEITSVEAVTGKEDATHSITGNLTMKDITKSITFPAEVRIADNIAAQTTQFVIDRTQWGVMYNSTAAGALKEKAIKDEIALKITLRSK